MPITDLKLEYAVRNLLAHGVALSAQALTRVLKSPSNESYTQPQVQTALDELEKQGVVLHGQGRQHYAERNPTGKVEVVTREEPLYFSKEIEPKKR